MCQEPPFASKAMFSSSTYIPNSRAARPRFAGVPQLLDERPRFLGAAGASHAGGSSFPGHPTPAVPIMIQLFDPHGFRAFIARIYPVLYSYSMILFIRIQ